MDKLLYSPVSVGDLEKSVQLRFNTASKDTVDTIQALQHSY